MDIQASLAQVFAVCALCTAVEALSGERAEGVRAVCGLSVALAVVRMMIRMLGREPV